MAEFKFDCPACKQAIACDELWAGHQIQCPTCQHELTVPQKSSLAPPPPPAGATRLSIGRQAHQPAPAPVLSSAHATVFRKPPPAPPKKTSKLVKALTTASVVLAVGAGIYFGWPLVRDWQEKSSAKSRKEAANSDGGQVGHIANLNAVLDATEPGGRGLSSLPGNRATGSKLRRVGADAAAMAAAGEAGTAGGTDEKQLPVVPPVYTLDVEAAKIPEGRANGMISGTNFVVETARIDPTATAQLLRLSQGPAASPDRELLIYIHLKAGETLAGYNLKVAQDSRTGPQVLKRWKPNPKYAAQSKSFPNGYALKLELGQIADGFIPGKIFLALPDTEQSVVAGVFKAATIPVAMSAAPANPAAMPVPAGVAPDGRSPADRANFDKRYGIKR